MCTSLVSESLGMLENCGKCQMCVFYLYVIEIKQKFEFRFQFKIKLNKQI